MTLLTRLPLALTFSALVIASSSCTDFLNVKPEAQGNTNDYFKNDFQAKEAIEGAYSKIDEEEFYGRSFFYEQAAANDIAWGRSRDFHTLATFDYTGNESALKDVIENASQSLARGNWIVAQLLLKQSKEKLTPIEERSLGEAYFLRGLMHFILAYRYGSDKQGVPFDKYEDFPDEINSSIAKQRATVMENYSLIIEDFQNAEKYLPKFEAYGVEDKGRPSKFSAVGFSVCLLGYFRAR